MFTAENRKKSYYEKLRHLVKIVFDGLALGNYILNNTAKSTIEISKRLGICSMVTIDT